MKTMLTLFVTAISSLTVLLSSSPATAVPVQIITDVSGKVHIRQSAPCGQLVDVVSSIEEGRMEITPHVLREGAFFDLTRLDMFLAPFSVEGSCGGLKAVANFTEIGVRLASAVRFQARALATDGGPNVFRFVIPKESFLLFESVVDDLKIEHADRAYLQPTEDVVGFVELTATERGIEIERVQLAVALRTELRFRAGCLPGGRCRIDEVHEGFQIADLVAGTVDGDTTPPTVACTRVSAGPTTSKRTGGDDAGSGNRFRVSASDAGGTPAILLGGYELAPDEIVMLQSTGRPGVRMLPTPRAKEVRHFLVGPGENFVTATDPAGNSATAYCR